MQLLLKIVICTNFFICSIAFAQGQNIDSLKRLTQSENHFKRATSNLALASFYLNTDSSLSEKYYTRFEATDLSPLSSEEYRKVVEQKSDFLRAGFRFRDGVSFLNRILVKNETEELMEALCHQLIATHYFYLFLYDSSYHHLDKAYEIYLSRKDSSKLGLIAIRKSGVEYTKGNYEKAIGLAFDATELFKSTNEEDQLCIAYLQLGNIFYFLKNHKEAREYYELSAEAFKNIGDSIGYYQAISNIGLILLLEEKYRESISVQRKAAAEFKRKNRILELGNSYQYLAEAYKDIDFIDSSEYYNELAIKIMEKTNYIVGIGQSILLKSIIAEKKGKLREAIQYALRARSIADSLEHFESLKLAAEKLSELYEKKGNTNLGLKFLKESNSLRDSLDIDAQQMKDYAILHQFKVEEAQFNLMLSQERERMQNELNRKQRSQLITAVVIAIISIISLAFTIIILLRNKKLTKEIAGKNKRIKEELLIKESLLSEIHHRVKNNLQVITSMLSLQTQYITDEDLQKVIRDCQGRINSMSLIHESLYKKLDGAESLFSTYIQNLIPKLVNTYHIDESKIKLEMDLEPFQLSLDESIPCGLIINEVVSNSLKHAFPSGKNGVISIELKKNGQIVELRIADNGIGLDHSLNLKNPESFGFLLIDILTSQLEAEVKTNSQNGLEYKFRWSSKS